MFLNLQMFSISLRRVTWEYCKNSIFSRVGLKKKKTFKVQFNETEGRDGHVQTAYDDISEDPSMFVFFRDKYVYYDNIISKGVFTWNRVWENTNPFWRYIFRRIHVSSTRVRSYFIDKRVFFFFICPSR